MPTMERPAGRSAAYGRACLSCFKTKCKCIPRLEGNGCERCHRLKRECQLTNALWRRNDKKSSSSEARIAKLEGTIGQLVSLLQDGNVNVEALGKIQGNGVAEWSQQQQQSPSQPHQQHQLGQLSEQRQQLEQPQLTPPRMSHEDQVTEGTSNGNGNSVFMPPPVSPSSASISLDTFRSRMLQYFPFVHLPAHLTAEHLRLDRPFLFRAIACVTSLSDEDKSASSFELKRVLCETAFLQWSLPQKQQRPQHQTVDLLLGLLVYIAWGWDHLLSRRSLSRLMMVAISLVGELRLLDQPMPEIARTISHLEPKGSLGDLYGTTAVNTPATSTATVAGLTDTKLYLKRQRAILGCFVLGSAVSAYFSHIEAPRWMPQMDEGLAAITASAECPFDAALAIQVRLQLLAMKASQTRERSQLPDQPPPETLSSPALMYIKTLLGQLQELRATIPPAFQQHFVLLAQTHYTEMCIIETVHLQQSVHPPPPTCGPTRLSCLWQSALAIKSCTSTFRTLSPSRLLGVPFIHWAQLARCMDTLHQLSTLQEPGWDPAVVRTLIDLPVLLTCAANKLDLAAAEAGEQPESANGVFTQLARGLRMFQSAYHDGGIGTQEEAAQRASKAEDGAGVGVDAVADANMPAVTPVEGDIDTLGYSQHAGDMMSPTLWLDQFFVDYEDQTMSTP